MPRSPIPSYLTAILDEVRPNTDGANADYIEGLRNADPDKLALAVCTRSGHLYSVGDDEYEFTIQSISKPFVYAVALDQLGEDKVHNHVGVEPSGEAFNELSLDDATHRPANPMINAGAIAVNRMVGDDAAILSAFSRLAGRTLTVDESILQGELATADRNLALAHMLREYGMITGDVHDAVESYTRQCSILVTVRDLAVMAATLANGGLQPVTGERVLSTKACRLTQAVMASCGMYDGSGRWMSSVGIPAKSGVAGGLIGTLPGQLGAASLSPRLNSEGNSVRGVDIFQSLSSTLGLHMMASNYYSAPGIRAVHRKGETNIVELQGMINFIAAETILHDLVERKLVGDNLVLDFRHVTSFNLAGRRLVKEGLRQFREDGFDVAVYDPASAMPIMSSPMARRWIPSRMSPSLSSSPSPRRRLTRPWLNRKWILTSPKTRPATASSGTVPTRSGRSLTSSLTLAEIPKAPPPSKSPTAASRPATRRRRSTGAGRFASALSRSLSRTSSLSFLQVFL